ncbi:hypothetical protein JRO89_XSUnG0000300 [Xanthoceras sorbifolium]|uniref:Uncharacterized protein n=1 Tax=Xanthoceras sorbifolium TaxID=99658 RepID=A0ABQ8H0G3_9ROSI|nr:hypothetical protein JRO89_XSUnG0000300 [Xanthoceras sorbifolium]
MEDDGVQQIKASEDVRNEIDLETTKRYVDLYVAALEGDWGKAEAIYKDYPDDAVASLSDLGDNALHVAAAAGRINFVKQLVMSNYRNEKDLEKKNKEGNTALTLAAMSENVQLALLMIQKNKKLAMIRTGIEDNLGLLPVQMAALLGLKKIVNCLYTITREELKNEDRIELLVILIDNNLYVQSKEFGRDAAATVSTIFLIFESFKSMLCLLIKDKQKDSKALFVLQQALADAIFPRIMGATSAKEAWDTLKQEFHCSETAFEDVDDGVQQIEEDYVPEEIDPETRKRYEVLYEAALEGVWGKAEAIYKDYPGDAVASLSDVGDTALHVAAAAGHTHFVKQLIMSNYMKEDNLEKKNKEGNTALTLAAMSENVQLALLMIQKNKKLAMIRNDSGILPVQTAALLGLEHMVKYLYTITTTEELKNEDRIELLVTLIRYDLYDVALLIVQEHPDLADSRIKGSQFEIGETALHVLAGKPLTSSHYFYSRFADSRLGIRNQR